MHVRLDRPVTIHGPDDVPATTVSVRSPVAPPMGRTDWTYDGGANGGSTAAGLTAMLGTQVGRVRSWAARAAVTVGTVVILGAALVSPVQAAGPSDFPPIDHARGALVEQNGAWSYQVAGGDTAFSIARRFDRPLAELDAMTPYDLAAGELPAGGVIPLPSGLIDASAAVPTATPAPAAIAEAPVLAVPVASVTNPERIPASVERVDVQGETFLIGGAALIGLGAVFYKARRRDDGGFEIGGRISKRQARGRVKGNRDVYTPFGQDADELARASSKRGRSVRDAAHDEGYYSHYHPEERDGGHVMYGRPKPPRKKR